MGHPLAGLESRLIHLLLASGDSAGLGELMKALAARAARYSNRLDGRSGTL
jgi:putative transposase